MNERWPAGRAQKFRQAAFVYLHLGILYEAAGWVMLRRDMLPTRFGPPWLYLVLGVLIVAFVFWGLYSKRFGGSGLRRAQCERGDGRGKNHQCFFHGVLSCFRLKPNPSVVDVQMMESICSINRSNTA